MFLGTPCTILNKTNILHYKKNKVLLLIFLYLFALFSLIFFMFNVHTLTHSKYMYMVFVHQTNITYSNEVLSAKHVLSYGMADRVDSISLIFHAPWYKYCTVYTTNQQICTQGCLRILIYEIKNLKKFIKSLHFMFHVKN